MDIQSINQRLRSDSKPIDCALVRSQMHLRGWDTAQLAVALGVSRAHAANIAAGRRDLRRSPALRSCLAAALELPLHALFPAAA